MSAAPDAHHHDDGPTVPGRPTRRWVRVVVALARTALGVGLLAFALSREETREALGTILGSPQQLLVFFALGLLGNVFEGARLEILLRSQAVRIGVVQGFRIVALGTFFNYATLGPAGGSLARLWYLVRDQPGRRVEAGTVLVVDRVIAVVSMLALILTFAAWNVALVRATPLVETLVLACAATGVGLGLGALIALSPRVHDRLVPRVARLPFGDTLVRALEALVRFRGHGGVLALAFAVSIAGHLVLVALLVYGARSVVPAATPSEVGLLGVLGLFANALPITPGGIGVGEAAFDELFTAAGFGPAAALALGWRAAQLPTVAAGALWWSAAGRVRSSAA